MHHFLSKNGMLLQDGIASSGSKYFFNQSNGCARARPGGICKRIFICSGNSLLLLVLLPLPLFLGLPFGSLVFDLSDPVGLDKW